MAGSKLFIPFISCFVFLNISCFFNVLLFHEPDNIFSLFFSLFKELISNIFENKYIVFWTLFSLIMFFHFSIFSIDCTPSILELVVV